MTAREVAQQRFASDELDRLSLDVAATGPGLRNPTLNRAALAMGHLVGAGAIAREQVERRLTAAAVRAGLRQSEARATIRSGLDTGVKEPAFWHDRESHRETTRLSPPPSNPPDDGYQALMRDLVALCPVGGKVAEYLRSRGLPVDASPDLIALPAPAEQPKLIAELTDRHGLRAVLASGLTDRAGERLQWPQHRLGFVWRCALTGDVSTLQRRFLGTPTGDAPKTVFARGRRVTWPWGAHLLRSVPRGAPVAITEGVLDWIAWRTLHGTDAICIALPSAAPLRPEWLALLAGRRVFVALDSDGAGERASSDIVAQLSPCAAPLRIRPWPGCKDWSDRCDPNYRPQAEVAS